MTMAPMGTSPSVPAFRASSNARSIRVSCMILCTRSGSDSSLLLLMMLLFVAFSVCPSFGRSGNSYRDCDCCRGGIVIVEI